MDVRGEGEALVLVHGFPLDRTIWCGQGPLAGQLRLVTFDLPGFGDSPPATALEGLGRYSDVVLDVMDRAGLSSATLCGLSMGGYVLLDLWRRAPERIRRLVLCDTRAEADGEEARLGRDRAVALVREGRRGELVDAMLPGLLTVASREDPSVGGRAREMMERASDQGLVDALLAMKGRPDSTPDLSTISVPTLVMVGTADTLTPPADARRLQSAIPGAALVEIPDAAHLSPLENPEAFNRALLDFIHSAPGGPSPPGGCNNEA